MCVEATQTSFDELAIGFSSLVGYILRQSFLYQSIDTTLLQLFAELDKGALLVFAELTALALRLELLEACMKLHQLFLFFCHS